MKGVKPWVYGAVLLGAIAIAIVVCFTSGKTADGQFSDHATEEAQEVIKIIECHDNDIISHAVDLIGMS